MDKRLRALTPGPVATSPALVPTSTPSLPLHTLKQHHRPTQIIPGASVSSSLRKPSSNASSPRMRPTYLHTRTHTHAPAPRTNGWLEDEEDERKTPDSLAPTKQETTTTTTTGIGSS
ncbi:hypothetical protein DFJ58DRAFT_733112 [Suillus subalutaceus]|uniref:uncharacterized protein n=1 Tax=Suillus subalutaceus TaxID=48586 RepID=UPI001B869779|nr:uncharacterized protein DFJ58DRAFT_733112 [Suillus subalutaceus]KAG1839890.1 hypothetical protein DFJ58DRAFT_733112 [Suillus subalutaceus]